MRHPWGLMERLDLVEGAINLPPGKYAPVASATGVGGGAVQPE